MIYIVLFFIHDFSHLFAVIVCCIVFIRRTTLEISILYFMCYPRQLFIQMLVLLRVNFCRINSINQSIYILHFLQWRSQEFADGGHTFFCDDRPVGWV